MNRKSRDTSNIGYTRHMKKANKTRKHSTAYTTKIMSNTDSKKPGMNNHPREGLYFDIYLLFIYQWRPSDSVLLSNIEEFEDTEG